MSMATRRTYPRTVEPKLCTTCGEVKPADNFYSHNQSPSGLHPNCKVCQRRYSRLRLHNVNHGDVVALLEAQGGGCAICRKPQTAEEVNVDHDHRCCEYGSCGNCIRGLICRNCNLLIGHAKDSIKILGAAINYLQDNK